MKFCTDINDPQRINPSVFNDFSSTTMKLTYLILIDKSLQLVDRLKSEEDAHGHQRMNCNNFGPQTFYLASSSGQIISLYKTVPTL